MLSVLDAPDLHEHLERHDLNISKLRVRGARPGFWHTLAHGITKHMTHTPRTGQAPSCSARRPFETPMDRCAREHPSLALYALAII